MDITLKIHEGTGRLTGVSLCRSCSHSVIINYRHKESIFCKRVSWDQPFPIEGDVLKCNEYDNAALPSLHSMEEVAWTLRTDKSGKKIGFESPKKDED